MQSLTRDIEPYDLNQIVKNLLELENRLIIIIMLWR